MKVHWLAFLIMIGAALAVPAASAQLTEDTPAYIVTPGDDTLRFMQIARLSTGSVTQGQSQYYSTSVASGKTSFYADLNWGSTANSLVLTIVAPDATLGPFYDSADGRVDGRINIRISRSGGIASGTWWSQVYGHQVTGVQSYTYSTSAG